MVFGEFGGLISGDVEGDESVTRYAWREKNKKKKWEKGGKMIKCILIYKNGETDIKMEENTRQKNTENEKLSPWW